MTNDHRIYKKVIVVHSSSGDWSAIYLEEGQGYFTLWEEAHSFDDSTWAELINKHHLESVEILEVDSEWLEDEGGTFPEHFEHIAKDRFV